MQIENMKIEDIIKKINELYHKSQNEGLTKDEKELQKKLREKYISNVKKNFKGQLEGIELKRKK